MTYETSEYSVHDARPVECFKFIGSFRTYRYTSAEEEVTVAGETYLPIPGKRGMIRAGTQQDDNLSLDIEMPFDTDVVEDYAYAESPPSLSLELYRVHRGTNFATDFVLLWKGKVTSFSVDGRVAKVRVPSVFARALQADLPSAYYQAPCNHVLFDSLCSVSRAANTTTTSVETTASLAVTVADVSDPDNVLAGGEIVNTRTGERRLILSNQAGVINFSYPFVDMIAGDPVELTKGCDHSFSTCKSKFSNGARFGGHPYIPADNPFAGEVK